MRVFIWNIVGSRLRRYSSGVICEKTYPNAVFKFNFNVSDCNSSPTKIAVFSYRGKNHYKPLDENNMCNVSSEVLCETQSYINNALADIDIPEVGLTRYTITEYVNNNLAGYTTTEYVNSAVTNAGGNIELDTMLTRPTRISTWSYITDINALLGGEQ